MEATETKKEGAEKEKVSWDDLDSAADKYTQEQTDQALAAENESETNTAEETETEVKTEGETETTEDTETTEKTETEAAPDTETAAETTTETPETEKTQEKEEHKNTEPSKLGRKIASLKNQMEELQRTMSVQTTAPIQTQEATDDFVMPETKTELEAMIATHVSKINTNKVTQDKKDRIDYEYDYLSKIETFDKDPAYKDITDELFQDNSSFNKAHNRNGIYSGSLDAEINYANAKNFILQKQIAALSKPKEKQNPLKGKKPVASLGVGGDTKVKGKTEKTPTLDADAQGFVNSLRNRGIEVTDKFINKALSKNDVTGSRN